MTPEQIEEQIMDKDKLSLCCHTSIWENFTDGQLMYFMCSECGKVCDYYDNPTTTI